MDSASADVFILSIDSSTRNICELILPVFYPTLNLKKLTKTLSAFKLMELGLY